MSPAPSLPLDAAGEPSDLLGRCRRVLEEAWVAEGDYCRPNPSAYPHQWLWDSCFHVIAWAALSDDRCLAELAALFTTQLADGCVPHMRYDTESDIPRGPLKQCSSFTQPPIFAHAARCLDDAGFDVPPALLARIDEGLEYLWRERRTPEGLVYIVHPWESGADDSPRWDDWLGQEYERFASVLVDMEMVAATYFNVFGSAVWSRRFVAAPAAFNALSVHAFRELAAVGGNPEWTSRADILAATMDDLLWNEGEGLWDDLAVVGGGPGVSRPTLDGVLPSLVTADGERAHRALEQLTHPERFAAPYGLAYTARSDSSFDPSGYWRGAAWPQMNYLLWLAARRWDLTDLAHEIVRQSAAAALASGFAEYWNPFTGEGLGAIPQTWATVVAAYGAGA